jgi:hypothetical protein
LFKHVQVNVPGYSWLNDEEVSDNSVFHQCVDNPVTFNTRIIHLMFLLFDAATCFDLSRSSSGYISLGELLHCIIYRQLLMLSKLNNIK